MLTTVPVALLFLGVLLGSIVLFFSALLVGLMLAILSYILIRRQGWIRMGLGQDELVLRGVFGNEEIRLKWRSIERLQFDPRSQGLVLCEPLDHPATMNLANAKRVQFSDVDQAEKQKAELISQQRWIPFEQFSGWFAETEWLEKLRLLAPTLAADYDQVAVQLDTALKRKRMVFTIVGLVAVVAIVGFTILIGILGSEELSHNLPALIAALPSIGMSILILLLIPTLIYFAIANVISSVYDLKVRDWNAAATCLFMAAIQAGFAAWIVSSILFAVRK